MTLIWMWELDHKENWALKNWWFWSVVLVKTLESLLESKLIKSINPRVNQLWIFIERTDTEPEVPILWPPDAKNWLIGKDPDAGKDWRQKKGMIEDEMVGWHHQLDEHQFKQAPGVGDGQGSLECCNPWGCKESDTTEWLNWIEPNRYCIVFSILDSIWLLLLLMKTINFCILTLYPQTCYTCIFPWVLFFFFKCIFSDFLHRQSCQWFFSRVFQCCLVKSHSRTFFWKFF